MLQYCEPLCCYKHGSVSIVLQNYAILMSQIIFLRSDQLVSIVSLLAPSNVYYITFVGEVRVGSGSLMFYASAVTSFPICANPL